MIKSYLNWFSRENIYTKIIYTGITSFIYLFFLIFFLNKITSIKISYSLTNFLKFIPVLILKKIILLYVINFFLKHKITSDKS